jgi:TIR domain-containing protein
MSEKPVIFLSYATKDKKGALSIKKHLENVLRAEIFVASNDIEIGDEWQPQILNKLDAAKALFILLTENSLNSRWIWFEIGYFWKKQTSDKTVHIYPLYVPGISIPSPLDVLQDKCLDNEDEMMSFAKSICRQLGIKVVEE